MLDNICYRKNYLSKVIARVDFLNPLGKVSDELPRALKKKISLNFPIFEPRKAETHELNIGPGELSDCRNTYNEWLFKGSNGEKDLCLSKHYYWVEFRQYTKYEMLRKESLEILKALFKQFPELQIKRLGLRYINNIEIDGNPLDWNGFINPVLLSSIDFYDKNELTRAFQVQDYRFDDINLKFQFGIINPDYPAKIRRKHFVLDFDASQNDLFDRTDIVKSFDKFHGKIQEFFERSIGENLRGILNE